MKNTPKERKDIKLTRSLEAKNNEKKKSKKSLLLTLGTLSIVAMASIGVVYIIDIARNKKV